MATGKVLTDAQRKAFDEADAIFGRAYEEAASKLTATGLRAAHEDEPQPTSCISCDCPQYMSDGSTAKCRRVSCRHSILNHHFRPI